MTRAQMLARMGDGDGLPVLLAGDHLVAALMRIGPLRSDGFGTRAVDWPEIAAFTQVSGRISEPWEAETLFDMAAAYHDEQQAGADPLAIAPVDRDAAGAG